MIVFLIGLAQAISYDLSPLGLNENCKLFFDGWMIAFNCDNVLRFTNI